MQILKHQLNQRAWLWILIGLVFLLAIGIFNPPVASADGGGFPTRTPTITNTPAITLVTTASPTVTFTSLPPYPLDASGASSGEVQPELQQQVASSPTVQPAAQTGAQTAESGSFLGGCFPTGILILLAGILLVTFFFVRRTRKKPG
jgi:hypothetical protein